MQKNQINLSKIGNIYESFSYRLSNYCLSRLLHGYFLFKKRKGNILAGATTFFIVLSFCPTILFIISMIGYFSGDITTSKMIVLDSINTSIPNLAPWIYDSIESIINNQLKANSNFNIINILFLAYSLISVVSSFMYAINSINKKESTGGFIIEDIKSFLIGSSVTTFILGLIAITNTTFLKLFITTENSIIPQQIHFIFKYQAFPIALSLIFITLFYKVSSKNKSNFKNSFIGASSFIACFVVGKSTYWIYQKLTEAELNQNFGNFYTLVLAVLWVYFLVSAFLYGSSVAIVKAVDLGLEEEISLDNKNLVENIKTEILVEEDNKTNNVKNINEFSKSA